MTFVLTVVADLAVAVEAGMILAALLFIRRVAATTTVSRVTGDYVERGQAHMLQGKVIPDDVVVLRVHGPFLFGATDKLLAQLARLDEWPPIVILRLRNMTAIDATGMQALEEFAEALQRSGRTLLMCGAPPQPTRMMDRADFRRRVGSGNILPSLDAALGRAEEIRAAR